MKLDMRVLLPAAMVLLTVLLWVGPYRHAAPYTQNVITDVPVYQASSDATASGELPYRRVDLEYPPGAAVVFWAARFLPGDYSTGFTTLMLIAWSAATAGATVAAMRLGLSRWRQLATGVAMAATPLMLGALVATRFDAVVTALVAWMLVAAISERWRAMWVLMALAILVKLVPVFLVPVLLIWQAHRTGGRTALKGMAASLGSVAAVFLVIFMAAPGGLWNMFAYHLKRPVQIESMASTYMMVLKALADIPLGVQSSYGSQGLTGSGPTPVAIILQVVGFVLMVAVAWILFRALPPLRRGSDARLMVSAFATVVVLIVASAKVFSPQFMMWLLPATLLVAGLYGAIASGASIAAIIATQVYFPDRYWDLVALHDGPIWILAVRNALVLVILAACWPRPRLYRHRSAVTLRSSGNVSAAEHAPSARFLTD